MSFAVKTLRLEQNQNHDYLLVHWIQNCPNNL